MRGGVFASLGAGAIGIACAIVGLVQAATFIHLIILENEGKCDWRPCANAGTYLAVGGFLGLAVVGLAIAVAAVLLRFRTRLPREDRTRAV